MRTLPLLLLLLACSCSSPSQGSAPDADERAVLETVEAFFDVIATRDVAAGARLALPQSVFVNVRVEDGQRTVKHFSNAEWLAGMSAQSRRAMREAFDGAPTVLIEGDVAVVWGRYIFEVNGERSHTGVDAFNLIRTDDGWKIAGGAYTVVR